VPNRGAFTRSCLKLPVFDAHVEAAADTSTGTLGIWELELVPVRGYAKGCSVENVEFVSVAA
jgi:hypothetical protein